MVQPTTDRSNNKNKREKARLAINLAMESRWEEAVAANREILAESSDDVEALNRLGKALSELGRYTDARQAFQRVLAVQPSNGIAKKNLERVTALQRTPQRTARAGVSPSFFIEETGKTGVISLVDQARREVVAKLTAGETVTLEPNEHKLLVKNSQGEYLGTVEPKLGLRLIRLIRSGNRYEAAIASIGEKGVRVIIRETFQHPSNIGRLSFPAKGVDDFRPYVWEGALRYGEEDEDEGEEWGEEERDSAGDALAEYAGLRRGRRHEAEEEEEF